MADIYAASGSAPDIETAVGLASAGDTVRVPPGTYDFNIDLETNRIDNGRAGVQSPGGIDIIGAGVGVTTLNVPLEGWDSDRSTGLKNTMFILNGTNNLPIRIAHMSLNGSVDDSEEDLLDNGLLSGVLAEGVTDFRIDHIDFNDFPNTGAWTANTYVQSVNGNKGVIDHCNFDNTYKDDFLANTGELPYWGYGIVVNGNWWGKAWDADWKNFFGKYTDNITFIEDCTFTANRHCVAANMKGFYVLRYCTMTEMVVSYWGSYQDVHGTSQGCEVYNNTITNAGRDSRSAASAPYGQYEGIGLYSRGGFALYHDNILENFLLADSGRAITLTNDQADPIYKTDGVWIWDNTYNNVDWELQIVSPSNGLTIEEDSEYFLREPTWGDDGFTYAPYQYPHPLQGATRMEKTKLSQKSWKRKSKLF